MALYLVSFSGRLEQHADAVRSELQKWNATRLWNDVWIVEMDGAPEVGLPGLIQTEAAVVVPLDGAKAFFSIGRAAGIQAQLTFTEQVARRLEPIEGENSKSVKIEYRNNGETVFVNVVSRYLWERENSLYATDLCRLMASQGSDKGIGWHTYTPFYQSLFLEGRATFGSVFELGLGTDNEDTPSNMGSHGTPGASLRGWRDYFPSAAVYGADVDQRILFEEDRIRTFFVDQLAPETFADVWKKIPDPSFDFFLDDGLHTIEAAQNTIDQSLGKVKPGGFYIIEDVMRNELGDYLDMVAEMGMPAMSIDIGHPTNKFDNCLVIVAVVS